MSSLRTSILRPALRTGRAAGPTARRSVHHRVPLPYSLDEGLPGFLSPTALKTVAVDWQQGVLNRLNDLVRGTDVEHQSVLQTLKQTAQDPAKTLAFNYASEALNNSFFLSTLSPSPSAPSPSSLLSQKLSATPSLGSLPALISHFSAHVSGLHPASGAYVWLVTDPNGNLGVVGTYAGGTVLVNERRQMGYGAYSSFDLKVLGEQVEAVPEVEGAAKAEGEAESGTASGAAPSWQTVPSSRPAASSAASPSSASSTLLSSATISPASLFSSTLSAHNDPKSTVARALHPLLCVSTHQHCYLGDYGVWGRDEYVKKWWSSVEWKKVEDSFEAFTTRTVRR